MTGIYVITYICNIIIQKNAKMKFLHYLTTEDGRQIESLYSNSATPKMSLQASASIQKASYKIWNKETNEVFGV